MRLTEKDIVKLIEVLLKDNFIRKNKVNGIEIYTLSKLEVQVSYYNNNPAFINVFYNSVHIFIIESTSSSIIKCKMEGEFEGSRKKIYGETIKEILKLIV